MNYKPIEILNDVKNLNKRTEQIIPCINLLSHVQTRIWAVSFFKVWVYADERTRLQAPGGQRSHPFPVMPSHQGITAMAQHWQIVIGWTFSLLLTDARLKERNAPASSCFNEILTWLKTLISVVVSACL